MHLWSIVIGALEISWWWWRWQWRWWYSYWPLSSWDFILDDSSWVSVTHLSTLMLLVEQQEEHSACRCFTILTRTQFFRPQTGPRTELQSEGHSQDEGRSSRPVTRQRTWTKKNAKAKYEQCHLCQQVMFWPWAQRHFWLNTQSARNWCVFYGHSE